MTDNLSASLDRADELLNDLKSEYQACLEQKNVSPRAVQLTHEVCEKLRGVLDRAARLYWGKKVSASLSEEDRKAAKIYFPIADQQNSFDSIMGRWRWKAVKQKHANVAAYLLSQQPFTSINNSWLKTLDELAQASKHIDLVPQTRREERRIIVRRGGDGSVSWNPSSVTFSGNVSVFGAPIDPNTQRIVPTTGVTETIEIWVSFEISPHNVNAYDFCASACARTRTIVSHMKSTFAL